MSGTVAGLTTPRAGGQASSSGRSCWAVSSGTWSARRRPGAKQEVGIVGCGCAAARLRGAAAAAAAATRRVEPPPGRGGLRRVRIPHVRGVGRAGKRLRAEEPGQGAGGEEKEGMAELPAMPERFKGKENYDKEILKELRTDVYEGLTGEARLAKERDEMRRLRAARAKWAWVQEQAPDLGDWRGFAIEMDEYFIFCKTYAWNRWSFRLWFLAQVVVPLVTGVFCIPLQALWCLLFHPWPMERFIWFMDMYGFAYMRLILFWYWWIGPPIFFLISYHWYMSVRHPAELQEFWGIEKPKEWKKGVPGFVQYVRDTVSLYQERHSVPDTHPEVACFWNGKAYPWVRPFPAYLKGEAVRFYRSFWLEDNGNYIRGEGKGTLREALAEFGPWVAKNKLGWSWKENWRLGYLPFYRKRSWAAGIGERGTKDPFENPDEDDADDMNEVSDRIIKGTELRPWFLPSPPIWIPILWTLAALTVWPGTWPIFIPLHVYIGVAAAHIFSRIVARWSPFPLIAGVLAIPYVATSFTAIPFRGAIETGRHLLFGGFRPQQVMENNAFLELVRSELLEEQAEALRPKEADIVEDGADADAAAAAEREAWAAYEAAVDAHQKQVVRARAFRLAADGKEPENDTPYTAEEIEAASEAMRTGGVFEDRPERKHFHEAVQRGIQEGPLAAAGFLGVTLSIFPVYLFLASYVVGFTLERTPEFGQNVVALRKVWDEEVQPLFLNRFDANVIGGWGNFPAFAFRKVSDFIRGIFKNIVGELRSTQNKKT